MHDFLTDLRRRLEAAQAERRELDEYVRSLETLLQIESKRAKRSGFVPVQEDARSSVLTPKKVRTRRPAHEPSPYKEFLLRTMAGSSEWPLDRLKEEAARQHVQFDGKSPGQVLHFALVALMNAGLANRVRTGVWQLTEKARTAQSKHADDPNPPRSYGFQP